MVGIALADECAHDALCLAVGFRDRVEDAVPLVLDSATGRPSVQRLLTRRGGKLFGKGDQLGGSIKERMRTAAARVKPR